MKKLMLILFGIKPKRGTFLDEPPTFKTCKDRILQENEWYKEYKVSSMWVDNTAMENASKMMEQIRDWQK